MKFNIKFFITITALLLTSALLLVGCMYAVVSDYGESKPYNTEKINSEINNSINQEYMDGSICVPEAQTSLQKKFDEYVHPIENGKSAIIFNDEQYEKLSSYRINQVRKALTYDEALFLINDSINLYFKYDKICLTNAIADNIIKTPFSSTGQIIECYHGDFSEFEKYTEASAKYEQMMSDIYNIIFYRIYMHDSGFVKSDDNRAQLVSLNGCISSGISYKKFLMSEYEKVLEAERYHMMNTVVEGVETPKLEAPLLLYRVYNENIDRPYGIYIKNELFDGQRIFPTEELQKMEPKISNYYTSGENGDEACFILSKDNGTFVMASHPNVLFSVTGKYEINGDKLILYPNGKEYESCKYVLYKKGKSYFFCESESNQIPDYLYLKEGHEFHWEREY